MPRQVRKVASSVAVRTVAQTRASAATKASTSTSGRAQTSAPATRAALRSAASTAGAAPRTGRRQLPRTGDPASGPSSTASLPGVRQLRSRQVPLAPQRATNSTEVSVIFVQGKRRRSHSVASSRASESTCVAVGVSNGTPRTRATKRRGVPALRSSRSVTRPGCRSSRDPPQTRTSKSALRKQDKPAEEPLVTCPNCQENWLPGVIDIHTSSCTGVVYVCPLACENACQWRGTVRQLVDHIVTNHRSVSCATGPNAVIVLKSWRKAAPLYWWNLQTCLGHEFFVEIKKVEKIDKYPKFYGIVRLFGPQNDADRFEYRMIMKSRGKMARAFSYSSTVRAMQEDNSVIHQDDSFVFDSSQAEIFSYEGNLEVEVSVSVMKI